MYKTINTNGVKYKTLTFAMVQNGAPVECGVIVSSAHPHAALVFKALCMSMEIKPDATYEEYCAWIERNMDIACEKETFNMIVVVKRQESAHVVMRCRVGDIVDFIAIVSKPYEDEPGVIDVMANAGTQHFAVDGGLYEYGRYSFDTDYTEQVTVAAGLHDVILARNGYSVEVSQKIAKLICERDSENLARYFGPDARITMFV